MYAFIMAETIKYPFFSLKYEVEAGHTYSHTVT